MLHIKTVFPLATDKNGRRFVKVEAKIINNDPDVIDNTPTRFRNFWEDFNHPTLGKLRGDEIFTVLATEGKALEGKKLNAKIDSCITSVPYPTESGRMVNSWSGIVMSYEITQVVADKIARSARSKAGMPTKTEAVPDVVGA